MITEGQVSISAPAQVVWSVFTDVQRWSEWTESIESIESIDEPQIQIGNRFRVKQPGFPNLVWEVTAVDPGRSWTWEQRSVGGRTTATHEVIPQSAVTTQVLQQIEQRGPLGLLVGLMTRGRTRKYLTQEAEGLKRRSEGRDTSASGQI